MNPIYSYGANHIFQKVKPYSIEESSIDFQCKINTYLNMITGNSRDGLFYEIVDIKYDVMFETNKDGINDILFTALIIFKVQI